MNAPPLRKLCSLAVSLMSALAFGQSAATRSPFLPPDADAPPAHLGAADLHLVGIMSDSHGTRYCIYDASKRQSTWAGQNELGHAFVVVSSDAAAASVDIRLGDGRIQHLTLREAKTAAGPTVALGTAAGAAPARPILNDAEAAWRAEFNRREAENAAKMRRRVAAVTGRQ